MAKPLNSESQSRANLVRERLLADPAVQRLGLEVVRTEGTDEGLNIRIRKGDRALTLKRETGWTAVPLEEVKQGLKSELMAELETSEGGGPINGG